MTPEQTIEVAGRAGEPITLPVGGGAATGYEWQLELPEGVELVGETAPRPPPSGRASGARTGAALQVLAPPGRHQILARLARPWEPVAIRTLSIIVQVR